MRPPAKSISVETIRYAAARAVERTSLRKVADGMDMAASWLDGFISGGGAVPRAQTLKKLREWYLREAASLAEVDEATAAASLALLVEGLQSEADRARAARAVLESLAASYAAVGPIPAWLRNLLES